MMIDADLVLYISNRGSCSGCMTFSSGEVEHDESETKRKHKCDTVRKYYVLPSQV